MCGIAGFYTKDQIFNEDDLVRMTDCMSHRGPDAKGYFYKGNIGLGHRRLSIIDLSERANQPMVSHNKKYIMVYNGEVYNYSEIGALLKSSSIQNSTINFNTASDTEIVLEAFARHGNTFIHQLNGMFAFAIYDKELEELHLFRDRMGIKPLFYYWDGKNFSFASEMKSLLKLNIPRIINKRAIRDFLHLGYIPSPHTIYEDIFKMNSGSMMKVSKDGLEIQKYWNLQNKILNNVVTNKSMAMVKLSDLIISSVQYQLKSDVPFGVFLSGGIDSSLITAQAVELSSVKVNTFSIGFEENTHNESQYAKSVAKYLGTDHHEFIVSYNDAINLIEDVFSIYDEPFADSSAFPTLLVSKLARQHVTVTLSGEGGDELFFGYGAYIWANRLNNPLINTFRNPICNILSKMSNRYKRAGKMFDYNNSTNLMSHIFSQEQYMFTENELNNLLTKDFPNSFMNEIVFNKNFLSNYEGYGTLNENFVGERILNDMESQALFDLTYYLQDDLLTKVDRASMKYSIETRVPFLDHRVVEFALNLAPELKYKNGTTKYILKEILYQYIPKKYFDRPKQGFSIPLASWLKNHLRYLIDQYLNEEIIMKYNIVQYKIVRKMKEDFFNGTDYLYNRLWLLIVLHKWLEMNDVTIDR
jgi:asparagine synthase (glutamine-hydrolysing)